MNFILRYMMAHKSDEVRKKHPAVSPDRAYGGVRYKVWVTMFRNDRSG